MNYELNIKKLLKLVEIVNTDIYLHMGHETLIILLTYGSYMYVNLELFTIYFKVRSARVGL